MQLTSASMPLPANCLSSLSWARQAIVDPLPPTSWEHSFKPVLWCVQGPGLDRNALNRLNLMHRYHSASGVTWDVSGMLDVRGSTACPPRPDMLVYGLWKKYKRESFCELRSVLSASLFPQTILPTIARPTSFTSLPWR
ncbi:hypothetical protein M011DRAFT_65659 [Sporormia fimetaria CBS 119925]|uniref:Uncharacterized protein n=1 Tax=Sporormia fimetaria CBS 119925 TaxID=1340428 RepID=A0A6A6V9H2_9PLEO|nr:hypothetical protein M011DRAFT_65659 [Sporormia fimetaria CBS 119925]